ncbi:hypothetical protein QOT17_023794 [Balamuthia mandrillaris]
MSSSRMSAMWKKMYTHDTKAVWWTIAPVIGGGLVWATYMSLRSLNYNDIVIATKEKEPYLLRESPKLYNRERARTQTEQWIDEMRRIKEEKH